MGRRAGAGSVRSSQVLQCPPCPRTPACLLLGLLDTLLRLPGGLDWEERADGGSVGFPEFGFMWKKPFGEPGPGGR